MRQAIIKGPGGRESYWIWNGEWWFRAPRLAKSLDEASGLVEQMVHDAAGNHTGRVLVASSRLIIHPGYRVEYVCVACGSAPEERGGYCLDCMPVRAVAS